MKAPSKPGSAQPSRQMVQRTIQKYIGMAQRHGLYDPSNSSTTGTKQGLIPSNLSAQGIELVARQLEQDLTSGSVPVDTASSDVHPKRQRRATALRVLKLGGFALGDLGARVLSTAMQNNRDLEALDLGFNGIHDAGAEAIARVLEGPNTQLTSLYLSGNCIGLHGIEQLSRALEKNRCLRVLYLSGNSLRVAEVEPLATMLRRNHGLQSLYLGSNKIGDEGLMALIQALMANQTSTLRSLMLGQNAIGAAGIECLADALQQKALQLTTIELAANQISDKSGVRLAKALHEETHLENLYIDKNSFGDSTAAAVGIMLMKNSSLRVLDLSFCKMSLVGIRAVATGIQHSKVLLSLMLDGILTSAGDKAVAARAIGTAVHSNPSSQLTKLSGIPLHLALKALDLDAKYEQASNQSILSEVRIRRAKPNVAPTERHTRRISWNDFLEQNQMQDAPGRLQASTELAQVKWIDKARAELTDIQNLPFKAEELTLLEAYYCRAPGEAESPRIGRYARVEQRLAALKNDKDQERQLQVLRQLHYLVHVLDGLADMEALIDTILGI